MDICLICIGDELLKGATVNTNMAFIGECLLEIGVIPKYSLVVPDTRQPILDALDDALSKSDFIITTGGLGPTADDITKEVVAEKFGRKLYENGEIAIALVRYWDSLKRGQMPSRILNQALVPDGAEVLKNDFGTAPGLHLCGDPLKNGTAKHIILLPGPPSEMRPMFKNQALPIIKAQLKTPLHAELLHVVGLGESTIEDRMTPVIEGHKNLSVAYCASPEYVRVFLTSPDKEFLHRKTREVMELFKGELLSEGVNSLAGELLLLLKRSDAKLAVAESCTGGIIAQRMTDVPGASAVFKGGVVSYSNEVKSGVLGVDPKIFEFGGPGAVSAECAKEMVEGVCMKLGAGAGMATTGIAGPDGGTAQKPVGLVHIASRFDGRTIVRECHFRGGREQIRQRAASAAMNLLRRQILNLES